MIKTINPGAYGWRHQHWLKSFYPEDLPVEGDEDWRLAYYSNEFNTVLVPFDYWQRSQTVDCAGWLHDVDDDFQFFVECHESMLASISLSALTHSLKKLQPQLSALVFRGNKQHKPLSERELFKPLIDALKVDVFEFTSILNLAADNIWQQDNPQTSCFAFASSDLTDLKAARMMVENFVNSVESSAPQVPQQAESAVNMTMIVNHPQLQASDLSKFRTVVEIMGY